MKTPLVLALVFGAGCAQPLLQPPSSLSRQTPLEVESSWPGPVVRFGPYASRGGVSSDGRASSLGVGPYHRADSTDAKRLDVVRGDAGPSIALDCAASTEEEGARLGSAKIVRRTTELRCRVGAEGELLVRRSPGERKFTGHFVVGDERLSVRSVHAASGTLESWAPVGFVFEREGEAVATAQVAYRRAVWLGAVDAEAEHALAAAMTALLVHDLSGEV